MKLPWLLTYSTAFLYFKVNSIFIFKYVSKALSQELMYSNELGEMKKPIYRLFLRFANGKWAQCNMTMDDLDAGNIGPRECRT